MPRRPRQALVDASDELARRSPAFREIITTAGPCDLRRGRPRREHFAELARAINYQQLAGKAAAAIHGRFEALFDGPPTPKAVLALPIDALRGAGMSGSKAASVRDLAEKVLDGHVKLDRIGRLSDAEIVRELTLVRGIGRWTAEMFLIFQLGRLDVWPVDDFAVRKGYALLHDLPEAPKPKELEALGEGYRPYRSVAAWYCWRSTDTVVPSTLAGE
ncbi:MAG TPA: DNA-3-methyladenine glycosylase 2 family protein [Acidimicrobiia bacterium]|jgi:DNA-3-methyladenine glycosylase II|nr:DNA-3-methyladenine glycosylase 2 family protein [Acidimicrobiia bacterium]